MSPVVRGLLLLSLLFASVPLPVAAQEPASAVPVTAAVVSTRPTALGSFIDKLAFTGWQPLPLYTWQGQPVAPSTSTAASNVTRTEAPPPAGAFKNLSAENVPAGSVAPPSPKVASSQAVSLEKPLDMFGQTEPKLPELDAVKAAILGEYSLRAFSRKTFQRGQRFITINLYEFAGNDSAFAAYYFLRRGATTVVKRGDATSEDDDSISFVQGRNFVSIQGSSMDDDESKDVVRDIAGQVARAIPEHGATPYILSMMPQLEFLRGSEKLVMGQASARRFCPAPSLTAIDFKNCRLGCVADYQMREPVKERVKLLYLDYGNNFAAATSSYQSYIRALCQSRDEDPEPRLTLDSNQFRNGATYIEVQLRGARLVMVTGAKKKYSADLLLRQVR